MNPSHSHRSAKRSLALVFTLFCAIACTSTSPPPTAATTHDLVAPNANLFVQGIPPIPASVARDVQRYTDFRGHTFVDWHPTQREMLVAHRKAGASTAQLFRLRGPMAVPEQLTDAAEPISRASYEPRDGRYIVYAKASGGDEAFQLFRLDMATRQSTQITENTHRHLTQGWLHRTATAAGESPRLLVMSVPLDRTAQGGTRTHIDSLLWSIDPLNPSTRKPLATLPGGGWWVSDVARDDKRLLLTRYISAADTESWLFDVATLQRRRVLPVDEARRAAHLQTLFSADENGLLVGSDAAGEFRELVAHGLDGQLRRRVTAHIPWDISSADMSDDRRLLALQSNEDGTDALRLFDAQTLNELPRPALPAGNVGSSRFRPVGHELAFSLVSARSPSEIYTLNPDTGQVQQWTRAQSAADVDTSGFSPQALVRWPSFDGRSISGWLSTPPARFTGKRPVLIDIHGGPAVQAQSGFLGRSQYFVQELGVAIIRPNVRGSSGYGKTFLTLDDGRLREDSVKDIGALLDWIAQQPQLDPSRVVVTGGSYGGYMSLAVATNYAQRIAGSIDVVGISNFVSFLENTESYRRDLRRVEYGDERDPEMRAFLTRISPLTNAHRITQPIFVVQGRNDPRVPWTEAEQIVAKARANNLHDNAVWYLRAENEGHGFARKENADFQFYAMVMFLRRTLGL